MSAELPLLLGTAATIGAVHTVLGPDHYLPFIALSKARGWSLRKTLWVTGLCGVGHVAGSVVLGLVGITVGIGVRALELIESQRGEIAAWLLIAFGLAYTSWGVVRALRNKPHTHVHVHANGVAHAHEHTHQSDHVHVHGADGRSVTPWVLFIIFVFGPCEPLIPLLMYPAATLDSWAVALVAGVFGAVTIATMTGVVLVSSLGLARISPDRLGRASHALAGATILICGVAVLMGL